MRRGPLPSTELGGGTPQVGSLPDLSRIPPHMGRLGPMIPVAKTNVIAIVLTMVRWIFGGCSVDCRWIVGGLSVDVRWIFGGFSVDFRWISVDIRWIFDGFSMDARWIFDRCSLDAR